MNELIQNSSFESVVCKIIHILCATFHNNINAMHTNRQLR